MNQGSRNLVYRFVQNSLLQITRAGINLYSFVLVILVCCIMVMQSGYQYCCIQYGSSDTACPWLLSLLSFWPLKLCHKICVRLSHTDCVHWGCPALRVGHRWEGSSSTAAQSEDELAAWLRLEFAYAGMQQHLLIFFLPWWQLRLFGSPYSRSASLMVS